MQCRQEEYWAKLGGAEARLAAAQRAQRQCSPRATAQGVHVQHLVPRRQHQRKRKLEPAASKPGRRGARGRVSGGVKQASLLQALATAAQAACGGRDSSAK